MKILLTQEDLKQAIQMFLYTKGMTATVGRFVVTKSVQYEAEVKSL